MNSKKRIKENFPKLDFDILTGIPVTYQTERSECGLACLAMISSYYGKKMILVH